MIAVHGTGMGCGMLYWSRVEKIHRREQLLDLHSWRGDESVLDVGCGRGLRLDCVEPLDMLLVEIELKIETERCHRTTPVGIRPRKTCSGNRPQKPS